MVKIVTFAANVGRERGHRTGYMLTGTALTWSRGASSAHIGSSDWSEGGLFAVWASCRTSTPTVTKERQKRRRKEWQDKGGAGMEARRGGHPDTGLQSKKTKLFRAPQWTKRGFGEVGIFRAYFSSSKQAAQFAQEAAQQYSNPTLRKHPVCTMSSLLLFSVGHLTAEDSSFSNNTSWDYLDTRY